MLLKAALARSTYSCASSCSPSRPTSGSGALVPQMITGAKLLERAGGGDGIEHQPPALL